METESDLLGVSPSLHLPAGPSVCTDAQGRGLVGGGWALPRPPDVLFMALLTMCNNFTYFSVPFSFSPISLPLGFKLHEGRDPVCGV